MNTLIDRVAFMRRREEEEGMLRSRGDEKKKQGKEAKCLRNPQKSVLRAGSDVNPNLSVLHYYS